MRYSRVHVETPSQGRLEPTLTRVTNGKPNQRRPFSAGSEPHQAALSGISRDIFHLQRFYGNRYVQRVISSANDDLVQRSVFSGQVLRTRPQIATQQPGTIQRFKGSVDFIDKYDITGDMSGGGMGVAWPITGTINTVYIMAGTSGDLILNLKGVCIGQPSGFIKGGTVLVKFSLEGQRIPYRCTPQGEITIETAAITPGHSSHDSANVTNPFGSNIGVSVLSSIDGATNPRFLIEQITFAVGGGGIQVGVTRGPVSVGGPTLGAGGSESTSLAIRFNFQIIGAHPASPATPAPPSATAAAGAAASAKASVTGAVPARVTIPPPHSVYFANEAQTEGDAGELVRWAASLPSETKDAIRTGRLTTTVIGYASTTGTDRANFERYSRRRAEWVQRMLARTLGVEVAALHVGWSGSYTAPPADRSRPGGVANPRERRADITFAETAPMTPVSATAASSAATGATAHSGP